MTKAEWILWITSTLFQSVLAWQVIWEWRQAKKLYALKTELVKKQAGNG